MAELKIGQAAPRFSLKDKDGRPYSLGATKTDYTVLYFYPKDDTPGCTLEAKEFSKFIQKFKTRNVSVVGISGGTQKTKASFCKKYSLKVPLVSDTDYKVAKSYGAYGTKKFMGRSYQGIFRKTFLVDKSGKIARVFGSVNPEGHASEVLEVIDALRGGKTKTVAAGKGAAGKVAARKVAAKKVAAPKRAARGRATPKVVSKKVASKKVVRRSAPKRTTRPTRKVAKRK